MGKLAKTIRWMSMLALAAGGTMAGARGLDESALVWIENQSFGFEACAAVPGLEDAKATLAALRNSADGEIAQVVARAGVPLGGLQFMTMTPLEGHLACGAQASAVTFRVAAVDRDSGKFWSTDLTVRSDAAVTETTVVADMAADLTRAFRGVYTVSAMR